MSYSNALAKQLYTKEKEELNGSSSRQTVADNDNLIDKGEDDDLTEVEQAVLNREPHQYNVSEVAFVRILRSFCCCMKNREWYRKRVKNYEINSEIEEGLAAQMDIVEMIKWNRVFKFLTIVSLRKNQA